MELSDIFESEHEENWRIVFIQYTELYRQSPSIDVAMHFAFFCWYLLWQWDEISFPGETLLKNSWSSAQESCSPFRFSEAQSAKTERENNPSVAHVQ